MNTEIALENLDTITVQENQPTVVRKHHWSSIPPIILFSYVGVLIRLGLSFLANVTTPLDAAFWPNFIGCLIMGFIVQQKKYIHHQYVAMHTYL